MTGNNYFLGTQLGSLVQSQDGGTSAQPAFIFGRVIKIALDDSTKIKDATGAELPIGSIVYRDITAEKEVTTTEYTALPLNTNIKQFPLLNEVVMILKGPNPDIQSNVIDSNMYYSTVVNLWGSNHHNALPEPNTDISTILGKDVKELSDINPMYPFPGDILIEGRQGQSIRLGGYKSAENPLVDDSNNSKPYTIISNGQLKTDNGIDHIIEDINKDANSLYFLSDHKVDLKAANTRRKSYDLVPQASNEFKGNQIILNAGRLYLNAKEDSILLSAKESIGLNANTVNLDATDYFCVDGKKIFLGAKARTGQVENAVLGMQLDNWLQSLISNLKLIANAMKSATNGGGAVGSLQAAGGTLDTTLESLRTQIKNIKSNKVYIE